MRENNSNKIKLIMRSVNYFANIIAIIFANIVYKRQQHNQKFYETCHV